MSPWLDHAHSVRGVCQCLWHLALRVRYQDRLLKHCNLQGTSVITSSRVRMRVHYTFHPPSWNSDQVVSICHLEFLLTMFPPSWIWTHSLRHLKFFLTTWFPSSCILFLKFSAIFSWPYRHLLSKNQASNILKRRWEPLKLWWILDLKPHFLIWNPSRCYYTKLDHSLESTNCLFMLIFFLPLLTLNPIPLYWLYNNACFINYFE